MSKFTEIIDNYKTLSNNDKRFYVLNLAYILNLNIFNDKNITTEKFRVCSEINHMIFPRLSYYIKNIKVLKDYSDDSFFEIIYSYMIEIFDEKLIFELLSDKKSIGKIKEYKNNLKNNNDKKAIEKTIDIEEHFEIYSKENKTLLLKSMIYWLTIDVRDIIYIDDFDLEKKINILRKFNTLSLKIIIQLFSYVEYDKPYYPENIFFFELKDIFNKDDEKHYYNMIYGSFNRFHKNLKDKE